MTESAVVYIDGKPLWLRVSVGEVVSQQKWSETSVYSRGNADSLALSSVVREKHEFWVKEADGKEVGVNFTDGGFQVRDGQKVWVAWGGGQGQEHGSYLFAKNMTSGDVAEFISDWKEWLYKSGVMSKPLLYRIFSIWFPIVIGVFGGLLLSIAVFNDLYSTADATHALRGYLSDYDHSQIRLFRFLGKVDKFLDAFAIFTVFGAGFMAAWVPSFVFANIIGNLSFLRWREKFLITLFKKMIFDECHKITLNAADDVKST